MSKNLIAFSTFRDKLVGQHKFSNGDESFNGLVIFNFKRQSLREILKITIRLTTNEYGQISIEDGETLNSDIAHMDFNSNFQEYELSEDGFLTIKGKSEKMGSYEVKITQV